MFAAPDQSEQCVGCLAEGRDEEVELLLNVARRADGCSFAHEAPIRPIPFPDGYGRKQVEALTHGTLSSSGESVESRRLHRWELDVEQLVSVERNADRGC